MGGVPYVLEYSCNAVEVELELPVSVDDASASVLVAAEPVLVTELVGRGELRMYVPPPWNITNHVMTESTTVNPPRKISTRSSVSCCINLRNILPL